MPGWKMDQSKRTALYRLFDEAGTLLYVGIAFQPETRWRAHSKTSWGHRIARHEVEWFADRRSARAAEIEAIGTLVPEHNVRETDRFAPSTERANAAWVRICAERKSAAASRDNAPDGALRSVRREARKLTAQQARLNAAIIAAHGAEVPKVEIAKAATKSREWVSQIIEKAATDGEADVDATP